MKSPDIDIGTNKQESKMFQVIGQKRVILVIVFAIVILFAAGYVYQHYVPKTETITLPAEDDIEAAACVPRTGCTTLSCTNNRQWKYNSSGVKQCCAC
jgi:NADPH:quinone reductase-like Zn-dependent oxidoreductase